jgi:hypothetical protein
MHACRVTLRELLYRVLPAGHRRLPAPPQPRPAAPPRTPEERAVDGATSLTAGQARQNLERDG